MVLPSSSRFLMFIPLVFSQRSAPIIKTDIGVISGFFPESINAEAFWGIPYAQKPVGAKRFRPTQSLKGDQFSGDVYEATDQQSMCMQPGLTGTPVGDEDCLYLDIYRPRGARRKKLPIMVWFSGGGFVLGDKFANGLFDASKFSAENHVIVVTVNYRLGMFGFMALPELAAESRGATGNYGLLDQIEALRWVNRNGKRIGGDISKITIFGQSAGAISIAFHLVSRLSRPFFTRAVMQSGMARNNFYFQDQNDAFRMHSSFANFLNCSESERPPDMDRLECLRSLPASDLVVAAVQISDFGPPTASYSAFGPVIDGVIVEKLPQTLMENGKAKRVPVFLMVTQDEFPFGDPRVAFEPPPIVDRPLDEQGVLTLLTLIFRDPAIGQRLVDLYSDYPTATVMFERVQRDYLFHCPTFSIAKALSHRTYLSTFSYGSPTTHFSEVPFVFGTLDDEASEEDIQKSKTMQCYFANFATFGAPDPIFHRECRNGASLRKLPYFLPFGRARSYLSLRESPVRRRVEKTSVFDEEDMFSQEFASRDRCEVLRELVIPWRASSEEMPEDPPALMN